MSVRLYIENREVELTEDVQFAITRQFEDLSNPTNIINDWSKTVSLPFTQKNNELFGHIYDIDRVTAQNTDSYISGTPMNCQKWNGTGTGPSDYVGDSLVNGQIVCNYNVEHLQVGLQYVNWIYSQTANYYGNRGEGTFEFIYDVAKCHRFEFSLRDTHSIANNGEVYFVQWDLYGKGLVEGKKYVAKFKYKKEGGSYIIYDFFIVPSDAFIGIYFNPLRKLDFRLEWNKTVLMQGYAKMNQIKQNKGVGTYEITLFGELGKVFGEMKKITFDKSASNGSYLIEGSDYVDEYITRNLVYNSWMSSGQQHDGLYKKGETNYSVTDIIGFAPNNSFSEGFDYKSYQTANGDARTFEDVLGDSFAQDTGVPPATAIPNGMLPREIGEYRSYLQLPFIYWNKLFKIFQAKTEEVTGYQFEYDNEWFNINNPYWYNLVYMLKPFDTKSEETVGNYYKFAAKYPPYWGSEATGYTTSQISPIVFVSKNETIPVIDSNNNIILSDDYAVSFNSTFTATLDFSRYNNLRINPNNGLVFSIRVLNSQNNNLLREIKWLMADNKYTGSTSGYQEVFRFDRKGSSPFEAYPKLNLTLNRGEYGDSVKLEWKAVWLNSKAPFYDNNNRPFTPTPTTYYGWVKMYLYNSPINNPITCNIIKNMYRSYCHFTLNDLWNNDYNLFDAIINYCKMFRIAITLDEYNKKVKFMPYSKYFENYTVSDWTDKVDKSKDYIVTPVTFSDKYVLFNYKDNETKSGEAYKEKYGVNYGDYKLTTEYNFNSETSELFEDICGSVTNTDNVLSWTNLNNNHKLIYSFPAELYVYNKDKDDKQVDIFGSFYYHNGLAWFSTEAGLYLRNVLISDDTTFQQTNNNYFYLEASNAAVLLSNLMIRTSTYPKLDVVCGDNMCLFNVPMENYTYISNYSGKGSLYTNLWEKYINERYNTQNKKITCYLNISPIDYNNFDFNHFVKIGNQLCMINKIYDYDVTSNETTKVDLVTIQDINAYTDNDYITAIDFLSLTYSGTTYINGNTGITYEVTSFSSITEVTFTNGLNYITSNGVLFTISGNSVYATAQEMYRDEEDIDFTVTLINRHSNTASMKLQRYSIYPYPYISLMRQGIIINTIDAGDYAMELCWERTPTNNEDWQNEPIVEVTMSNGWCGEPTVWLCEERMYQVGEDEYFLYRWRGQFDTFETTAGGTVTITVTDGYGGWHQTVTYPIV